MNKGSITSNFLWRLFERFLAQGVGLIVTFILARILDPSVFGVIAIVTVITSILQVFIDGGLGSALIQKKDSDEVDFSSVFYFNVSFCILLYVLLFVFSPYIAKYYKTPELTPIIRVLGLTIIISGVKNIQQAYVAKKMIFRKFFFATLFGTMIAAAIGIIMALSGFGVWALVAQSLINSIIDTIIVWAVVGWKPQKVFSLSRLLGLLSFGWKLLVSRLLTAICSNIRQLAIGKVYTTEDLSFYNRGAEFPAKSIPLISTSIDDVLFSSFSKKQENIESLVMMLRKSIRMISFIIAPMLTGMAVCGESIIRVVLSDKWLPAYPFLCIFCCEYAISPISTLLNNAFKAVGRSDITLKTQIIIRTFGIVSVFIAIKHGALAIAFSSFFTILFEYSLLFLLGHVVLHYGIEEQIKDLIPGVGLSIIMGLIVYCIGNIDANYILILVLQVFTGVALYLGLSLVFKVDSFLFIVFKVKSFIRKESN